MATTTTTTGENQLRLYGSFKLLNSSNKDTKVRELVRDTVPPIELPVHVFSRQQRSIEEYAQAAFRSENSSKISASEKDAYPKIGWRRDQDDLDNPSKKTSFRFEATPTRYVSFNRNVHAKSETSDSYDTKYVEYNVGSKESASTDGDDGGDDGVSEFTFEMNGVQLHLGFSLVPKTASTQSYYAIAMVGLRSCTSILVTAITKTLSGRPTIQSLAVVVDSYDYANKLSYLVSLGRALIFGNQRTPYYELASQNRIYLKPTDAELTYLIFTQRKVLLANARTTWNGDTPLVLNVEGQSLSSTYEHWDNTASMKSLGAWSLYTFTKHVVIPHENHEAVVPCWFRRWRKHEHLDVDHRTNLVQLSGFPNYSLSRIAECSSLERTYICVLEYSGKGAAYAIFKLLASSPGKARLSVLFYKLNTTRHSMRAKFVSTSDTRTLLEENQRRNRQALERVDLTTSRKLYATQQDRTTVYTPRIAQTPNLSPTD
ncbi:MAG: hypothetical protein BVN35_17735 [Proteobacteria bacterium ST_bin11]|nr:MAG: hypothetical protein BVN35_17735 [Proteobacteria bacterium ST_bin11]